MFNSSKYFVTFLLIHLLTNSVLFYVLWQK